MCHIVWQLLFELFEHIGEDLNLALKKEPPVAIFYSTARVLRKEHTSFQHCERGGKTPVNVRKTRRFYLQPRL